MMTKKVYKKHGLRNTKFYRTWYNILGRCNRHTPRAAHYRDKWIVVLWKSFEEFYNDMYDSYLEHCQKHWEKYTSINRIDNNWPYSKDNCSRATNKEQMLNTSRSLMLEKDWKTMTAKERSILLWINENTIRVRHKRWQDPLSQWKIYKKWSIMPYYKDHIKIHWENWCPYIQFYQRIKIYWRDILKAVKTGKKLSIENK